MYGTARANDGYRARIGLIFPSVNTVIESWMPKVAPEGVTFHSGRVPIAADTSVAALTEMAKHDATAARMLSDCEPDLIMYACTASTVIRGRSYDLRLMDELTEAAGVRCVTTTESIVRALTAVEASRIVVVSPYPPEFDELEHKFFTECGFEVADVRSFGIADNRELADPSPGEIYRLTRDAARTPADAVLISCLALRSHYVAEQLEQDLGVPVITSTTATLWAGLRLAGVNDAVPGYGRLLRDRLPCDPARETSGADPEAR
jgi:maleate isomerase